MAYVLVKDSNGTVDAIGEDRGYFYEAGYGRQTADDQAAASSDADTYTCHKITWDGLNQAILGSSFDHVKPENRVEKLDIWHWPAGA